MRRNRRPRFFRKRKKKSLIKKPNIVKRFSVWLEQHSVVKIAAVMTVFLTIVAFWIDYGDREEERIHRAWSLLTTKAPGNSGKREAIQYLYKQGVLLRGLDLGAECPLHTYDDYDESLKCIESGKSSTYLAFIDLSSGYSASQHIELVFKTIFSIGPYKTESVWLNVKGRAKDGGDYFLKLGMANLKNAYIYGANLQGASLLFSNFEGANLSAANLKNASLKYANLKNTVLDRADLTETVLLMAKNLTCMQLTKAKNWETAYRNQELSCGASIPDPIIRIYNKDGSIKGKKHL